MARVFSDAGQSAKAAGRDAFQDMFRYLEANTGKVSHIIVYKYDRFSRNVDDGAEYVPHQNLAFILRFPAHLVALFGTTSDIAKTPIVRLVFNIGRWLNPGGRAVITTLPSYRLSR